MIKLYLSDNEESKLVQKKLDKSNIEYETIKNEKTIQDKGIKTPSIEIGKLLYEGFVMSLYWFWNRDKKIGGE